MSILKSEYDAIAQEMKKREKSHFMGAYEILYPAEANYLTFLSDEKVSSVIGQIILFCAKKTSAKVLLIVPSCSQWSDYLTFCCEELGLKWQQNKSFHDVTINFRHHKATVLIKQNSNYYRLLGFVVDAVFFAEFDKTKKENKHKFYAIVKSLIRQG